MNVQQTEGIEISVNSEYQELHSNPVQEKFVFAYHIRIENRSNLDVQLLSRHWFIVDAYGMKREVKGEGVIGQQPIISPGSKHEYSSWCPLVTSVGKMYGYYVMKETLTGRIFNAVIPEFELLATSVFN